MPIRDDKTTWELVKMYLFNWAILLDLAVNTLIGGSPRETLSSRMGKAVAEDRCVLCKGICWLLDLVDPDHCQKTIDPHRGEDSEHDRNLWQ